MHRQAWFVSAHGRSRRVPPWWWRHAPRSGESGESAPSRPVHASGPPTIRDIPGIRETIHGRGGLFRFGHGGRLPSRVRRVSRTSRGEAMRKHLPPGLSDQRSGDGVMQSAVELRARRWDRDSLGVASSRPRRSRAEGRPRRLPGTRRLARRLNQAAMPLHHRGLGASPLDPARPGRRLRSREWSRTLDLLIHEVRLSVGVLHRVDLQRARHAHDQMPHAYRLEHSHRATSAPAKDPSGRSGTLQGSSRCLGSVSPRVRRVWPCLASGLDERRFPEVSYADADGVWIAYCARAMAQSTW